MAVRTNLVTNPSAEVSASPWQAFQTATVARSTTRAQVGSASLAATSTSGSIGVLYGMQYPSGTSGIPVTAGVTYNLSVYGYSGYTTIYRKIEWYDSGGSLLGDTGYQTTTVSANSWTRVNSSHVAPTSAAYARPILATATTTGVGDVVYFDAVMLEATSSVGSYFDGDTTDTAAVRYDWAGTAHASTSTATDLSNGSATGGFDFTGSATGVSPFNAPTGLIATPISATQIDLSWDVHAEAVWYEVERDGAVIARWLTTNSYSDTGLTAGTSYDYRVRAVKNNQ